MRHQIFKQGRAASVNLEDGSCIENPIVVIYMNGMVHIKGRYGLEELKLAQLVSTLPEKPDLDLADQLVYKEYSRIVKGL